MLAAMMLMAAGVPVAAQPTVPTIIPPALIPVAAIRKGKYGAVAFNAFIDKAGRPLTCQIDDIIDADYGRMVCNAIMRTRYTPAVDRQGNPSFGSYAGVVNLWVPDAGAPGRYPVKPKPDLTIAMKADSPLADAVGEVDVAVMVDSQGHVAECAPANGDKLDDMVDVACAAAETQWTGQPFESPQGTPRSYVRNLKMAFVMRTAAR